MFLVAAEEKVENDIKKIQQISFFVCVQFSDLNLVYYSNINAITKKNVCNILS